MQLILDGRPVEAAPGESLLSIIKNNGMDSDKLGTRPLAAAMGGEVFTLNFVPLREGAEKPRRSVRLCGGRIDLLRIDSPRGRSIYERSALFVLMVAVHRIFPRARVKVEYALGGGIFCRVFKESPLTVTELAIIEQEYRSIVAADHPFSRTRLDKDEAMAYFEEEGQTDKVELLRWRHFAYFDVYDLDGYKDYFYGEMLPSTGYLTVVGFALQEDGFLLLRPDGKDPEVPAEAASMSKLSAVMAESSHRGDLLECSTLSELNELVRTGRLREVIRVNEALHEKNYAIIADSIIKRGAKAVMLAGPSSSGKTTSANRLATQLRVHGKKPMVISMDDFYRDRDTIIPGPDGKIDLEHINTLDIPLFRQCLADLLAGKETGLPMFDFLQGKCIKNHRFLTVSENSVLIIEGIHALNPALIPEELDSSLIFKVYVSALTTMNLDDHNRIPTSQLRLLRRMVRDFATRGASVERTLSMWDSVRAGEERWIFPYQEQADAIFNTTLVYEVSVMKRHIFPLLQAVCPDEPYYDEVNSLVKFLNYFLEADVDDEIPPTSILREFIGGNSFYRKG